MICGECGIDDDDIEPNEDLVSALDSVDKYFQPSVSGWLYDRDHVKLLSNGLEKIESAIASQPGDPGTLYPLDERVRRVIGALQARVRR